MECERSLESEKTVAFRESDTSPARPLPPLQTEAERK
jgi:hypothetical protein